MYISCKRNLLRCLSANQNILKVTVMALIPPKFLLIFAAACFANIFCAPELKLHFCAPEKWNINDITPPECFVLKNVSNIITVEGYFNRTKKYYTEKFESVESPGGDDPPNYWNADSDYDWIVAQELKTEKLFGFFIRIGSQQEGAWFYWNGFLDVDLKCSNAQNYINHEKPYNLPKGYPNATVYHVCTIIH